MANHEQDQTAGADPPFNGADRDGHSDDGAPAASRRDGHDGLAEGTFRWPSPGLPRVFGQPADEAGGDDHPGGRHRVEPDSSPAGLSTEEPGAQQAGGRPYVYGPAGEYDPPEGDPLAEYSPAGAADQELTPPPREEPPHWQRPETADSLTADLLLPGPHNLPPPGWRRIVYQATGGLVHPQLSAAGRRRRELVVRACTPVATGHHRVAVMSLKGGVGKTTTVMGLGSTLSSLRGDRVIAVDANPDRGTLSDKLRLETAATVRDLLNERDQILRYADVRAFTTQAPSRLEVLASDRDPTVPVAFSDRDYEDVAQVLEHYYSN